MAGYPPYHSNYWFPDQDGYSPNYPPYHSSQWFPDQNVYSREPQKSARDELMDMLREATQRLEEQNQRYEMMDMLREATQRLDEWNHRYEIEREAREKKLNADCATIMEYTTNSTEANSPLLEEDGYSHEDQELVENEEVTYEEACTSFVIENESSDSFLIPRITVPEDAYFETRSEGKFEEAETRIVQSRSNQSTGYMNQSTGSGGCDDQSTALSTSRLVQPISQSFSAENSPGCPGFETSCRIEKIQIIHDDSADTLAIEEEVQEPSTMCIKEEISMVLKSDDPFRSLQSTKFLKDHYEIEVIDSNPRSEVDEDCMEDGYLLEPIILPSMKLKEEVLEFKKPYEHDMEHIYLLESKLLVSIHCYLKLLGVTRTPPKLPWWKVQKRRKAQSKRVWILRYPP